MPVSKVIVLNLRKVSALPKVLVKLLKNVVGKNYDNYVEAHNFETPGET